MIDRSKNLMAYNRHDTSDGHGGRAEQHYEEMREIALKTIYDEVPKMISNVLKGYFEGLQHDVNVIASVAVDTAGEIYRSEEVKRIISNEIYKQMIQYLPKTYHIDL